jgi:hypothetical protein
MIFHVVDVDAFWTHLKKIRIRAGYFSGWFLGRTLFHMHDPDGHEVSFARPL